MSNMCRIAFFFFFCHFFLRKIRWTVFKWKWFSFFFMNLSSNKERKKLWRSGFDFTFRFLINSSHLAWRWWIPWGSWRSPALGPGACRCPAGSWRSCPPGPGASRPHTPADTRLGTGPAAATRTLNVYPGSGFFAIPDPGSQCCGSMTFWCGSGSADPCLWLMDPDPDADPDPSIFIIDLQDANKKKSQNIRNQGFSYWFCLMIEGSEAGSRAGSGSGSIPLTNGSGWPKNMWIRIRNTAESEFLLSRIRIKEFKF